MLNYLRDISIKSKLLFLVETFILGLIVFWYVSWTTLNLTKVNGPLYEKIVRDKDLLADILPPPGCLLEPQLLAHQMCQTQDETIISEMIDQYKRFKAEYGVRMAIWRAQPLQPATQVVLQERARPPAEAFFVIMDEVFIPAIRRNDTNQAKNILDTLLTPMYNSHREAIDNLVMRTTQATLHYEAEVAELISMRANVLFATGVIVVLIGAVLAFFIISPIVFQMRNLEETLHAVAGGNLEHRMTTSGKGEFGRLAVAVNEMINSLVQSKTLAEAASHAKGEFLANMSHEIRTPLTAVLGYCDILRDDLISEQAPNRDIQTIATIRRAEEHLLTVINDILDLSKIEAGKLSTEQISMSLPQILLEVDSLMRPRLACKGVQLKTLLKTPIPDQIISDPTRLRQIVLNLVGNAVKFTDHGYVSLEVWVDRSHAKNNLRVEVQDTGCGMTEEQAAALFRPFTQADASVTRKYGGTGLGLTISQRLAHMMGGEVRLDFTEPEKGSRFVLEIPLIEASKSSMVHDLSTCNLETNEADRMESVQLSGRILLAEDGEDNQHLIAFVLRKAGANVEIAENGRIALEMLNSRAANRQPYDLLLTDMQMPEMDGYTLAKTLRANGEQIPIVALTAHAMAEDRQKCENAGCNDYASKPINKKTLIHTCWKWMKGSHGAQNSLPQKNESKTLVALEAPIPQSAPVIQEGSEHQRETETLPNTTLSRTENNPMPTQISGSIPQSASDNELRSNDVLISELSDDPEMASLVIKFLGKLDQKTTEMSQCLSTNRWEDLARLAHQLKGAGGSYGYPSISEAAQRLEKLAKSQSDFEGTQRAVEDVRDLCQRAIRGNAQQERCLTDTQLLEQKS